MKDIWIPLSFIIFCLLASSVFYTLGDKEREIDYGNPDISTSFVTSVKSNDLVGPTRIIGGFISGSLEMFPESNVKIWGWRGAKLKKFKNFFYASNSGGTLRDVSDFSPSWNDIQGHIHPKLNSGVGRGCGLYLR